MSSIAEVRSSNSGPQEKKAGMISHNQAIELFRSMQTEVEHRQFVSGRVVKIYSDQADLPSKTRKDGVETYAWEMLGNIDVKLNYNNKTIINVGPMCSHFNCMPLIDEEVVLVEHDGQVFYDFPLNRMGKVNHNRSNKVVGEKLVFEQTTYMARPVVPNHGDTTIQGRFGNYMMFTSEPTMEGYRAYPKIVIGNNQDRDALQVGHKNFDPNFPHFHNANSCGSVIEMTTSADQIELEPSAIEQDQEEFFETGGDMISISSDSIIINSAGGEGNSIFLSSGDAINLTSMNEINIATIGNGQISIGKTDATSAAVKGSELKNFMISLLDGIQNFCNTLDTFEGDGSAQIKKASQAFREFAKKANTSFIENDAMFSKKVFIQ